MKNLKGDTMKIYNLLFMMIMMFILSILSFSCSPSAQSLLDEGSDYYYSKQYSLAIEKISEAIEKADEHYGDDYWDSDPENKWHPLIYGMAYRKLALSYKYENDYNEAINYFKKDIDLELSSIVNLKELKENIIKEWNQGNEWEIKYGEGKVNDSGPDSSFLELKKIINEEYRCDAADDYFELGDLYTQLKQYNNAQQAYIMSIALNPKQISENYLGLSKLYQEMGDSIKANKFYNLSKVLKNEKTN